MDYNMTAYLPIGSRNTWAFNYLRSDAIVSRKGETDPAKIQSQQGINCSDPALTATATAILYRCGEPDDREQYLWLGDVARRL